MPLSSTQVTGPVYLPNLEKPDSAKIVFELSSWDMEEGEAVFVTGPYVGNIDENGNFSVSLFTTDTGENNVVYRVSVIYLTLEGTYKREQLGTTALAGPGPYKLADLDFISEWTPNTFDVLAQAAAYKTGAEAAYDLATAAVAALAAIATRTVDNFDDLESIDIGDLVAGEYWIITNGNTLLEVVTSSEDILLGNGGKFYIARNPRFDQFNLISCTEFVKYPDGTSGVMEHRVYEVDSSLTGAASAGDPFGVDGILYDSGRDSEIDALLALTFPSGTLVGTTDTQTLTNKTLTAPTLTTPTVTGNLTVDGFITEKIGTLSGTTPAIDPATGTILSWTLTGDSTPTDSLANGQSLVLLIDDGTDYTITWTIVDKWIGGVEPTLSTTDETCVVLFKKADTLYGLNVGDFS